ncbi:MAG: hypothetical protein GY772_16685, partial [bacterium]|nr:hypothetical protein [bacterium]
MEQEARDLLEWVPLAEGQALVPPGLYFVPVTTGPTYLSSGFDLDFGAARYGGLMIGRLMVPTADELTEWADLVAEAVREGGRLDGGWGPERSAVVVWLGDASLT